LFEKRSDPDVSLVPLVYVPGLPAHYPSYGRRTSSSPLSPGSGPSTPLGPAFSYDQPLTPSGSVAPGQYFNPPSQQGGSGDFAQGPFLFQHEAVSGGGSGSTSASVEGSRSSTPLGRGAATGSSSNSNTNLRGAAMATATDDKSGQRTASSSPSRKLPAPIQTTGLNDVYPAQNDTLGSAPSTPRSRLSYNPSQGYSQPYYPSTGGNPHHSWSHSAGMRNSYSGRGINLQMPTPLDPNTPRQGYLTSPTSPRAGSMYGLNDFGGYHPGSAMLAGGGSNVSRSRPGSGSGSGGSGSYSPNGGSVHGSTRMQGKRASGQGLTGNGVVHQPSTSSSLASGPSGEEGETMKSNT
jgi:hypothetical protein